MFFFIHKKQPLSSCFSSHPPHRFNLRFDSLSSPTSYSRFALWRPSLAPALGGGQDLRFSAKSFSQDGKGKGTNRSVLFVRQPIALLLSLAFFICGQGLLPWLAAFENVKLLAYARPRDCVAAPRRQKSSPPSLRRDTVRVSLLVDAQSGGWIR